MISLSYLFEVIPDSIEYTPDAVTDAPTKIWKAKMKAFQDRGIGEKLYDKLHPPQENPAYDAAVKKAKETFHDGYKSNWYKK